MGRQEGEAHPWIRTWQRVLEKRLRARLQAPVAVEMHDNTHTMLTFQRTGGFWRFRLHHMFLSAGSEVLHALVRYARRSDPDSSALLDRFIERNRAFIRRPSPTVLRSRIRIAEKGSVHDLGRILRVLNQDYFRGRIAAAITYGPAGNARGRSRKSIKMGSYSAEARLIRIHPALDRPEVPRYFVEWIVFHEMLHHVYRIRRDRSGRRCVHPPEFLAHERRFRHFDRARRWEQENLDLLLQS